MRLKLLSFSMLSCVRNNLLHCKLTICVVFVVNIDKNHFSGETNLKLSMENKPAAG